jgi:hypothetical protein
MRKRRDREEIAEDPPHGGSSVFMASDATKLGPFEPFRAIGRLTG